MLVGHTPKFATTFPSQLKQHVYLRPGGLRGISVPLIPKCWVKFPCGVVLVGKAHHRFVPAVAPLDLLGLGS